MVEQVLDKRETIAPLIEEVLVQYGLRIEFIFKQTRLVETLDSGLVRVYQEAFKDPPYNEYSTHQDVHSIFMEILNLDGVILTLSQIVTDECIGFFALLPLSAKNDLATFLNSQLNVKRTAYYAEAGVAKTWRRKGISKIMNRLIFKIAASLHYKSILVRTSIYNYKQIAAFGGLGLKRLSNNIQEIKRESENYSFRDIRAFYIADLDQLGTNPSFKILSHVSIIRPGGNDTAIVWDSVPKINQPILSLAIQSYYPGIEQVVFVEKNTQTSFFRAQMAGNEYCINAVRALGYILLNGKDGEIYVEASGTLDLQRLIIKNHHVEIEIPFFQKPHIQRMPAVGEFLVTLENSTFLVMESNAPSAQEIMTLPLEKRKEAAFNILKSHNLLIQSLAGLILVDKKAENVATIHPYIYVRETKTLYYETACGSGSLAAALIFAQKSRDTVYEQQFIQPSGETFHVCIERNNEGFAKATLCSKVEIIFSGKMELPVDNTIIRHHENITYV